LLDLLDEQPLAANLGERAVLDLVAARLEHQQLDGGCPQPQQAIAHMVGLPERQRRAARGDDHFFSTIIKRASSRVSPNSSTSASASFSPSSLLSAVSAGWRSLLAMASASCVTWARSLSPAFIRTRVRSASARATAWKWARTALMTGTTP